MATTILPSPTEQGAKPATEPPRCKGCHAPWLPGHACMTPSRTPTTPTHWHRPGATRFGTFDGQRVYPVTFLCGCQRVGCAQGPEAEAAEVAWAAARACSSCRFRAGRSELDEEALRA